MQHFKVKPVKLVEVGDVVVFSFDTPQPVQVAKAEEGPNGGVNFVAYDQNGEKFEWFAPSHREAAVAVGGNYDFSNADEAALAAEEGF